MVLRQTATKDSARQQIIDYLVNSILLRHLGVLLHRTIYCVVHSRLRSESEPRGQRTTACRRTTDVRAGVRCCWLSESAPEQVTLRGSHNGDFVFRLGKSSFARGDFSYDFVAEARQAGNFAVKGYVIPFLAPVTGQEFAVRAGTKNGD